MFIQTEETPNPSTLKFLPGRTVMDVGTAEFLSETEAKKSPLAAALFLIDGVESAFFGADFISVTKSESKDWLSLKTLVLEALVTYFSTNEKVVVQEQSESVPVDEDKVASEIRDLLDNRVRPAVAMDGGDITFEKFEDGVVYLKLKGACSGCPSSSATLKSGIENMLRYYIPEVKEVRPLEEDVA